MTTIHIVCDGDIESHGICAVFFTFVAAEAYAVQRANVRRYERNDEEVNTPEVALWIRSTRRHIGRIYGYISIEKWETRD